MFVNLRKRSGKSQGFPQLGQLGMGVLELHCISQPVTLLLAGAEFGSKLLQIGQLGFHSRSYESQKRGTPTSESHIGLASTHISGYPILL